MSKTVFISYHFNDKSFKGEIQKWLKETGVNVISVDEKDLRTEGSSQIESGIKEQIGNSDLVLILVGDDTHNRPWVDYEVAVARTKGVPTYWVRLSNRTGAAPKEVRGIESIRYDKHDILNLINR